MRTTLKTLFIATCFSFIAVASAEQCGICGTEKPGSGACPVCGGISKILSSGK